MELGRPDRRCASRLTAPVLSRSEKRKAVFTGRLHSIHVVACINYLNDAFGRMFVAVLRPYPKEISPAIEAASDTWKSFETIDEVFNADFVISYGHRRIIRKPQISRFGDTLINLHISYLPWNIGADPNLWSFIDGTSKGVSIHIVDKGLDTGPILIQRKGFVSGTLATSYQQLRNEMRGLFAE